MLIFNGTEYQTNDESIYSDIGFTVADLAEAESLCNALASMDKYTFNGEEYVGMVVSKRIIIITDTIVVKVKLREKTDLERAREEISSLRTAMEELALSTNKTTTAKINKILDTKVVE